MLNPSKRLVFWVWMIYASRFAFLLGTFAILFRVLIMDERKVSPEAAGTYVFLFGVFAVATALHQIALMRFKWQYTASFELARHLVWHPVSAFRYFALHDHADEDYAWSPSDDEQ